MAAKKQLKKSSGTEDQGHKIHTRSSKVAILFTDIKGSTALWEKLGDNSARQLVEKHNRLLFPIVKGCRGKVIKTIGDSIMARFKSPYNAVKAAVAMQQLLNSERAKGDFPIHIRIGIHYGRGIIESKDVYGDLVNTAARIESKAKGGQILISSAVRKAIRKRRNFTCHSVKSFVPKGKSKSMQLYSCDWKSAQYLPDTWGLGKTLSISPAQKYRLLLYLSVLLTGLFFLFENYIRFFIADSREGALLFLNTKGILPFNTIPLIAVVSVVFLLYWLARKRVIVSMLLMRFLKGGFIGTLLMAGIVLLNPYIDINNTITTKLSQNMYASKHFFVRVEADRVNIRHQPPKGTVLRQASEGAIFILEGTTRKSGITYNRLWLGKGVSGYIPRVLPPKVGVPAKRLTYTDRFYLKGWDVLAAICGIIGFLLGALFFKVKPL